MRAIRLSAAVVALALSAGPGVAQDAAEPEIIRASDTAMTCAQIADEAAGLSATMGEAPRGGLFSRIGDVAKAGAAILVPGAGVALAAADAMGAEGRERRESQASNSQHRWYYLNGLYAGQGCQSGAAEAAQTSAQAAPAEAVPTLTVQTGPGLVRASAAPTPTPVLATSPTSPPSMGEPVTP